LLVEVTPRELDCDGAFAHGRSDALDRPVAHVTGSKDSRDAGFQQEGRAL
jgi:hypothetical protein